MLSSCVLCACSFRKQEEKSRLSLPSLKTEGELLGGPGAMLHGWQRDASCGDQLCGACPHSCPGKDHCARRELPLRFSRTWQGESGCAAPGGTPSAQNCWLISISEKASQTPTIYLF